MTLAPVEDAGLHDPAEEYHRLRLALRDASPGMLVFVQMNARTARRGLPERLRFDGLKRPYAYYNFADRPPDEKERYPTIALADFLAAAQVQGPVDVFYIDGFESRPDFNAVPQPGDAIEKLNLGREALAHMGCVVVFLVPAFLVELLEHFAMNLWSWRGYHFVLELPEVPLAEVGSSLLSVDPDRESRESLEVHARIRTLSHELGYLELSLPIQNQQVNLELAMALCDAWQYQRALEVLDLGREPHVGPSREVLFLARWWDMRARALWGIGERKAALHSLERARQFAEQGFGREHAEVARILRRLGWYYHLLGQTDEAERCFTDSASIVDMVQGSAHPDLARTLLGLASVDRVRGNISQAETEFARVLDMMERAEGPTSPAVARVLQEMAQMYLDQGQYQKSEAALRRAVGIYEQVVSNPLDLAAGLHTLAVVLLRQVRSARTLATAEGLLKRSLEVAQRALTPEHPALIPLRSELAQVYLNLQRPGDAQRLLTRAESETTASWRVRADVSVAVPCRVYCTCVPADRSFFEMFQSRLAPAVRAGTLKLRNPKRPLGANERLPENVDLFVFFVSPGS